ncbi:glycosyltransferase family 2 protein [Flavisolibacter sp. BT320]|nr:glycosyltransferase family 2 protein [Flavisolibacter longurius]
MGLQYRLKASFAENVNVPFRIQTKLFHIFKRTHSVKNIPIFINNYNRLDYLQRQIDWLRRSGHNNIHVIDNCSTYAPLLNYYKKIPATVYRLDRNMGHEAFWRTHIFLRYNKSFYVLTDPDVVPGDDVPPDFMQYFIDVLNRYPAFKKVGFGLRTDNLPDHYPKKQEVIRWEEQFYEIEIEKGLFKSKIDTTFALYRPGSKFQCWNETIRTGSPYMLMHLPWYEDPSMITAETAYYLESCNASSSWYQAISGRNKRYELR